MESINILKYSVKNNWLEIEIKAKEFNDSDKFIEILLRNRDSKEEVSMKPLIEESNLCNKIIKLDLSSLYFDNANKNMLDLYFLINNKKYRMGSKSINLKKRDTKYSTTLYKINSSSVAVPYLTINNNLALLYGNANTVLSSFCHKVKNKLPVDATIEVNHNKLLVNLDGFQMADEDHFLIMYNYSEERFMAVDYKLYNTTINIKREGLEDFEKGHINLQLLHKKRNILSEIIIESTVENELLPYSKKGLNRNPHTNSKLANYNKVKSHIAIDSLNVEETNLKFTIDNLQIDDYDNFFIYFQQRGTGVKWLPDIQEQAVKETVFFNIDLSEFIKENNQIISRWDVFIELAFGNVKEVNRLGYYNASLLPTHERYFHSIKSTSINLITPYLTVKNGLSIAVKPKVSLDREKLKSNVELIDFKIEKGIMFGQVILELEECNEYKADSVLLMYRSQFDSKTHRSFVEETKNNANKSKVNIQMNMKNLEFEKFYWDIYLVVSIGNDEILIRVKNPSEQLKKEINQKVVQYTCKFRDNYILYPYITSNNGLSFTFREKDFYENTRYRMKEYLAGAIYSMFKNSLDKKQIWLVYEKFSQTAQDNSYYFFNYVYKNHPNENVYYILDKNSPDQQNLKGMKNRVLKFMGFRHLLYLYASKLLVSSEAKGHAYIFRKQNGRLREIIKEKKLVFLQHGVMGLKKVQNIFGKQNENAADLFVVSSEFEHKIIENNFGYDKEEIMNVGLCRWDALVDKSSEKSTNEILLMPTWRWWLDDVTDSRFIESDYYRRYADLLNSSKLQEILLKNDVVMNFYIHPRFKEHIEKFYTNNLNMKIYQFGEEKVNELLMQSSLLITDYSSVAWDQYYQKKPVIFYQFDYNVYERLQGSYLDMETELFGDRVLQSDELINVIEEYISRDFVEKEKFAGMRKGYFDHVDQNNSKRTYEAIKRNKKILE